MKSDIQQVIRLMPDGIRMRFLGGIPGRSRLTGKRRPYSGAELRAIRKEKGVGRPPAVNMERMNASKSVQD